MAIEKAWVPGLIRGSFHDSLGEASARRKRACEHARSENDAEWERHDWAVLPLRSDA
jgi:hypothetical protein